MHTCISPSRTDAAEQKQQGITYILFEFLLQGVDIIVGNRGKARHEGSKSLGRRRIVGGRDGRQGTSPKVIGRKQDAGLAIGNALDVVTPPTGELDGRLATFDARIHGQDAVVAKEVGDKLGVFSERVVVKGTTREREFGGLVDQGLDNLGVAMPLIDGRVGGKELCIGEE